MTLHRRGKLEGALSGGEQEGTLWGQGRKRRCGNAPLRHRFRHKKHASGHALKYIRRIPKYIGCIRKYLGRILKYIRGILEQMKRTDFQSLEKSAALLPGVGSQPFALQHTGSRQVAYKIQETFHLSSKVTIPPRRTPLASEPPSPPPPSPPPPPPATAQSKLVGIYERSE